LVFSEPTFLFLFLPLVLLAYFSSPRALRNGVLLAASLLFYAWGEKFWTLVMLLSIAGNYWFGLKVAEAHGRTNWWLGWALGANLALLIGFKYSNFLADNLSKLLVLLGLGSGLRLPPVHLPIGISFYTFQAMSYLIDVARGETRAQRDLLKLGLYKALFPQLIAGPIVRYVHVEAEIEERHESWSSFADGTQRFVVGLAKKVLLANPLGALADEVFGLPTTELSTPVAWLGISAYALQIYFDFSGYSDMAIGLGRMFGFKFLENFNYPYAARSITDFWRRWHISLSTWFRDYLYIPLGGNRAGPAVMYRNLLIVFALCGLWHGASWNFLIWGLLHGALLVAERRGLARVLAGVPGLFARAYVLVWILITWVFFRAETLAEAGEYLGVMFWPSHLKNQARPLAFFLNPHVLTIGCLACLAATPIPSHLAATSFKYLPRTVGDVFKLTYVLSLLLLCVVLVATATYNPFIYFRF